MAALGPVGGPRLGGQELQRLESRLKETRIEIGLTPWVNYLGDEAAAIADQAEFADRLGFHSLFLPESHFTGQAACPSPIVVLAAAAARTKHLRLGTTSYLLPVRNAFQAAEEVAVLDRLSSGRVILGLGRGFRPALFAAFGVDPRTKRQRFLESLDLMKRAWAGEAIEVGESGARQPVRIAPLPVQQPHPELWVAAFGPLALKQAGELGLPYLSSPLETISRLTRNHELHREALPQGASRPIVPVMRTVFISEDRATCERVGSALTAQALRMARAGTRLVQEEELADIENWAVVGGPDEVRAGFDRYRERIGMTHVIARCGVPDAAPWEIEESIRALAHIGS
ncbi:MAG: LLM class flavin-dependent oxidoreductase [Holophagales bacterium]|nr:LLM class flavin-dependent oxidoreductase [Holophagales bacterium]MXX61304.1 LLM class flavin-dependent oxidoreductase [Holophagales bacterium]MYC09993.1 LLM class flavin-dependent oxidoreductase [Holophagales bacterium]MYD24156.1 LLM class flavin-dependent oxidoreductase [Holophagales bacterium]MYI34686.1 LLM class flavin-dependent oxidoreductase [Holophagales bacterium]